MTREQNDAFEIAVPIVLLVLGVVVFAVFYL